MTTRYRSVVIEADGGSRGNPGNAAYGAVLKDAETGTVIAERGERIGIASNNVAEYQGLIAGLRLYREYADGAKLEVRMDSKLVVQQMSGQWKIKHPSMRPLAVEAKGLAPGDTTYTWIPREQNTHADLLANQALDSPEGVVVGGPGPGGTPEPDDDVTAAVTAFPTPPWEQGAPTTLVLIRHGETDHTRTRRFSGRMGANPGLNDDGRAQIRATADWLAPLAEQEPIVLASPMRRTQESAEIVAARLETSFAVDEGFVEAGFGRWEGMTYREILEREPDAFSTWLNDPSVPPGGNGDSLVAMVERMRQTRDRILAAHPGRTVVALSHLTPIKILVHDVLETPLTSLFRSETSPGSVSVLAWYPDGRPVVRLLNGQPAGYRHDTAVR